MSHLDTHLDSVQLKPEFFDVFLDLAEEFHLPLRLSDADAQRLAGFPFRSLAADRVVSPDRVVLGAGLEGWLAAGDGMRAGDGRVGVGGTEGLTADAGGTGRWGTAGDRGRRRDPRLTRRGAALLAAVQPRAGVTEICLRPAIDTLELRAAAPDWRERAGDHRLLASRAQLDAAVKAGEVKLIGYRALAISWEATEPALGRSFAQPSGFPWDADSERRQNSVIASVSACSCLYSAEFVMGSMASSLAMLPVTLTRPCMNAALASSSPFWIRIASS